MKLRAILLGLVLSVPVAATDVVPTAATVSHPCTITWYYRDGGYPYKMYSRCSPGTTYQAQRAKLNCTNGPRWGIWQSLPGPWYGSTATCLSGGHATGTSYIEFY